MSEVLARASGRVNLIGEHTDYNDGFVLPTLIPQETVVRMARRDDRSVRLFGENVAPTVFEYRLGEERPSGSWGDYAQGATSLLLRSGVELGGFDAHVASSVPIGSGLSSSAALSVALLRALREMFRFSLEDVAMALLCQRLENEFVGARVGIMDPFAVTLGSAGKALFVDTRSLEWEAVPLPMDRMDLLVVSSGVVHRNAGDGGYNRRREECESACERLGVGSLRDLPPDEASELVAKLPEPLRRRARHVVTENARVLATVAALKAGDLVAVGRHFVASHRSLRDDYEVSVPEIDFLVAEACADPDVFGARITGGGFGGSIVAITRKGASGRVAAATCPAYERKFGRKATVLVGGSARCQAPGEPAVDSLGPRCDVGGREER